MSKSYTAVLEGQRAQLTIRMMAVYFGSSAVLSMAVNHMIC